MNDEEPRWTPEPSERGGKEENPAFAGNRIPVVQNIGSHFEWY